MVKLIALDSKLLDLKSISNILGANFRNDQMCGNSYELLMELAGRICYNSIHGKGRDTKEYFKNILESEHYSILAHSWFCFELDSYSDRPISVSDIAFRWLSLEPGTFIFEKNYVHYMLVNLRTIMRWFNKDFLIADLSVANLDGSDFRLLFDIVNTLVFNIIEKFKLKNIFPGNLIPNIINNDNILTENEIDIVNGFPSEFRPITFWIKCSRSCSHELIRHNYNVAISQRSTRYVDESKSNFIHHPLTSNTWIDDEKISFDPFNLNRYKSAFAIHTESSGLDRKAARGIAARYLPHGIETQLVMTFPRFVLDNLFKYRINEHADAEIRQIAEDMKREMEAYDVYRT